MGSTPVEDSENSFSEYFDLRALLRYLVHFTYITVRKRVTWRTTKHPYLKSYGILICKFYKITLIHLFYITVIMPTDFEVKVLVTD